MAPGLGGGEDTLAGGVGRRPLVLVSVDEPDETLVLVDAVSNAD